MSINILYICTGKYTIFWKDFYLSCEKLFIPKIKKTYYIFTDDINFEFENKNNNINIIYQENLGWPNNTLMRYHVFLKNKDKWTNCDYIFFFNANLLFTNKINSIEFLPQNNKHLLACIHPGFFDKQKKDYPYEHNKKSQAFIDKNIGSDYYFAGGINGGKINNFILAAETIKKNIDIDLKNNKIAIWHDESHWNKYVLQHINQVKIISPAFLYPEGWNIPFEKKILIRDKNKHGGHNHLRDCKKNNLTAIFHKIITLLFNK